MSTCRHTGKNGYETEREALSVVDNQLNRKSTSFLRVYKCNWCYQWHLTSRKDLKAKRR